MTMEVEDKTKLKDGAAEVNMVSNTQDENNDGDDENAIETVGDSFVPGTTDDILEDNAVAKVSCSENRLLDSRETDDKLVGSVQSENHSDKNSPSSVDKSDQVSASSRSAERSEVESRELSAKTNEPVATQHPLSFTIDFGDNKEVDTVRYRNLFERYNARHKRNLSSSKVETKATTTAALLSPNILQKQKAPSTHSEGYFSSDQEDDARRRTDQLSRKLDHSGLTSPSKKQPAVPKLDSMSRSFSERSSYRTTTEPVYEKVKDVKLNRGNLSLQLKHAMNDVCYNPKEKTSTKNSNRLSRTDFEKAEFVMTNHSSKTKYTKNTADSVTCRDYEYQDHLEQFGDFSEKVANVNSESDSEPSKKSMNPNNHRRIRKMCKPDPKSFTHRAKDLNLKNVSVEDDTDEPKNEGSDDAVSEAGTYTIHKDYTDEEKARMDIDRVFSVGVVTEEESSEAYVHSFKMSISRDNNWISNWATQVAEHNSLPTVIGETTRRTPTLSPTKIPSPIHSRSRRLSRGRQEHSDSSLEMESYLQSKEINSTVLANERIDVDSGGESDEDTSHSRYTPPEVVQHVPMQVSALVRRGSLSEVIFNRNNHSMGRRSVRQYVSSSGREKEVRPTTNALQSPSTLARLWHGRRNSSLDRKDVPETRNPDSFRRSSLKTCLDDNLDQSTLPIPTRVKASMAKLTNSPILIRREPTPSRTGNLEEIPLQAKNIGYFTCTENSPYMLRKSFSTTNYHNQPENPSPRIRDVCSPSTTLHQNSPVPRRSVSIQRSCSNASVRNSHTSTLLARRSSFSNADAGGTRITSPRGKLSVMSDSSSEAGEKSSKSSVPPISSGIKLNRAFSIRRARLNCESDTTPNTTPEERRKKAQTNESKSSTNLIRQQPPHARGRSVISALTGGANSKESARTTESPKSRALSTSRTDSGRINSARAQKNVNHNHLQSQHPRQSSKQSKDKKPGRSNSTLTAKEVEFQNWKRRKNYDPMKAAAKGKRKPEVTRKQHDTENNSESCENTVLRSASFHGTGGTLTLAGDWSDDEYNYSNEYIRPPPPSSPQLGSDSDLETSSYLRMTENVMTAMSARMNERQPPLVDSGGESDDDTSHSLHRPANRKTRFSQASDTESSDEPRVAPQSPIPAPRQNKTYGLPKVRTEPRDKKISPVVPKTKSSPRDTKGAATATATRVVSRTDSGRFINSSSLKGANMSNQPKAKENKKSVTPSTKEVEMQNWKRRKSYDPMKAAMEGKRKISQVKRNLNPNSASSHVLRSQSFHGSVGLGVSDWSEEELNNSADEASLY